MRKPVLQASFAAAALLTAGASAQTVLTIASVNNPDMVTMQELSTQFEEQNPDIALEWLFLDEGTLRNRLTTDVATGWADRLQRPSRWVGRQR